VNRVGGARAERQCSNTFKSKGVLRLRCVAVNAVLPGLHELYRRARGPRERRCELNFVTRFCTNCIFRLNFMVNLFSKFLLMAMLASRRYATVPLPVEKRRCGSPLTHAEHMPKTDFPSALKMFARCYIYLTVAGASCPQLACSSR